MGILSWLIVGLIAGFVGSKVVNRSGEELVRDIILGILVRGCRGRYLHVARPCRCYRRDLPSIVVAAIGAILLLVVYHAIFGKRATV